MVFLLRLGVVLAAALPVLGICLHTSLAQLASYASLLEFYFVLLSVPMLALYLARTYKNGMASPIYVIDETQTQLS